MSLSRALEIGRSGLVASQAAIQVTGNNLANSATRGYHRQSTTLAAAGSDRVGQDVFIGRGVTVQNVVRQVDDALETRIRSSVADQGQAQTRADILSQIESIHGELTDNALSTSLTKFFDSWSELANRPLDNSLRSLVVQQGSSLASSVRTIRSSLIDARNQTDEAIDSAASSADDLLSRIADLNTQIAKAEGGSNGSASGLRDQRDSLLSDLSGYMDITTVEQTNGTLDVYSGSLPIVLNNTNRGLRVRRQDNGNGPEIDLTLAIDGSVLTPVGGKLGGLVDSRRNDVQPAIAKLDDIAGNLIFEVNKIHSSGQGTSGFGTVTSDNRVVDASAALNTTTAGLAFTPQHGSFDVLVKQKSTGLVTTKTINVDLDSVNPAANTSLNDLAASLNGAANLQASVTADNRLKIDAVSGDFEFSFANDTSGALAALGVNTYFSGKDASDIAVNTTVSSKPGNLAAGQGGVSGDNRNALALSDLRSKSVSDLGGLSVTQAWNRNVENLAVDTAQARQQADSATIVRSSLETQQQSVSGVNVDEEAINLLAYQRSYQASARFLTVVDQMMQTLLQLVG